MMTLMQLRASTKDFEASLFAGGGRPRRHLPHYPSCIPSCSIVPRDTHVVFDDAYIVLGGRIPDDSVVLPSCSWSLSWYIGNLTPCMSPLPMYFPYLLVVCLFTYLLVYHAFLPCNALSR